MTGKQIGTVAQPAVFTGDHRTAASQARMAVPDDPEAVIARNTVKTMNTGNKTSTDTDQNKCCKGKCKC